jgi:hypothetical protein
MRGRLTERNYHPGFEVLEGRELPAMVLWDLASPASLAAGLANASNLASDGMAIIDNVAAETVAAANEQTGTSELDQNPSSGAEAIIAYELMLMGGAKANDAMFVGINGGTSPFLGSSNSIYGDDDRDDAGSG